MGRGPTPERSFELILRERGVSEKNIGWVLSKLDSQEYALQMSHYLACIHGEESETHAKEIFINRYFSLNLKGISRENTINDLFKECIDKRKIWTLLEKNFGVICIKLLDANVNDGSYLFVCGPNKRCPNVIHEDSFVFFFPNEIKEQKKQNPLDMTSLRVAR